MMSAYKTSSFGMEHKAANDDLKKLFDDRFEHIDDTLKAWPTGSCVCSKVCCSGGCDSCVDL